MRCCATTTTVCGRCRTSCGRSPASVAGRGSGSRTAGHGRRRTGELSSTHRAAIEAQRDDDVFRRGPPTIAHDTPDLYTFWLARCRRIREIVEHGSNSISGRANHDTLRRGTQVSPAERQHPPRRDADGHPRACPRRSGGLAAQPCLPSRRADGFPRRRGPRGLGLIRSRHDRYGVKIMAEDAVCFDRPVDERACRARRAFSRPRAPRLRGVRGSGAAPADPAGTGGGHRLRSGRDRDPAERGRSAALRSGAVHAGPTEARGACLDGRHARPPQSRRASGPAVRRADGLHPRPAALPAETAVAARRFRAARPLRLRPAGRRHAPVASIRHGTDGERVCSVVRMEGGRTE